MTKPRLNGRVALVTGASRGGGKGIALVLGEEGATVYVTGRSLKEGDAPLPGTIGHTAELVTQAGGHGIECFETGGCRQLRVPRYFQ